MLLLLPSEIPIAFPRATIMVEEGQNAILQDLTANGVYYVIAFLFEDGQKKGILGYITSPPFTIGPAALAERPYSNRILAESDAADIRQLQKQQREEGDASLDFLRGRSAREAAYQHAGQVLGWGPVPAVEKWNAHILHRREREMLAKKRKKPTEESKNI